MSTIILITGFFLSTLQGDGIREVIFHDGFETLENWEKISFGINKKPTRYTIVRDSAKSYLFAVSRSSASGYLCRYSFDTARRPLLRWRWMINELVAGAGGPEKPGDDYALRIFVLF